MHNDKLNYEDEVLGTFVFDESEYIAEISWLGIPIELCIEDVNENYFTKALQTAYTITDDVPKWDEFFRSAVAKELLPLKNTNWLKEDEKELEAKEFSERLEIQSITAKPEGKFVVYFDDDDMFEGYGVSLFGTMGGEIAANVIE